MQQYEKVAFIVKIKELSVRKSRENRLKSLKRAKKCNPNKPEKQISRLTATIDAFTMRIKSKLFEQ